MNSARRRPTGPADRLRRAGWRRLGDRWFLPDGRPASITREDGRTVTVQPGTFRPAKP